VEVNGLRTRVKFAVMQQPIPMPEKKTVKKVKPAGKDEGVKVVKNLTAPISPLAELNVIGLTVQEALVEIDPFLDSALVSGLEEVKIVHGFGSGRLRKGIQEYLRTHRNVESFRLGKYGEGEGGVTIVKLK
jgi:DNA mismatch repair protein MutS2